MFFEPGFMGTRAPMYLDIVGVFFFLVYCNIISSPENSFAYGRSPILFVAAAFTVIGLYIVLYNAKRISPSGILSKILFFVVYISILAPFHIVIYKEIFIGKNINLDNIFGTLIIAFFDIIPVLVFFPFFVKKLKK